MRQLPLASTTESSDFRADSERLHGHESYTPCVLFEFFDIIFNYYFLSLPLLNSAIFHVSTCNSKKQEERGRGKGLTRDSVMRAKSFSSRLKPYAESLDAGR